MINKELDKKIAAWIDAHRETILQQWMDLIRIPSVRGEAAPKAPYGAECARALKKAVEYMEQRGFSAKLNEDDGYAITFYGEGEKTIGLYGHSDVVPVGDGWLFTDPFTPVVKDGLLFGRGACDNKNGVMASISVLECLRDLQIPLKGKVMAFVGTNEESGMGDVNAFVRNEEMPDLNFAPDSGFPCGYGEKGILRMWAECGDTMNTVRDFCGGDAFNVVLDKATVTLAPNAVLAEELRAAAAGGERYEIEEAADALILRTIGISKHASVPAGSINAAVLACDLLVSCPSFDAHDKKILQAVSRLIADCFGSGMDIEHEDPDGGKLTAANGMVAMENGHLRISIDSRYGITMPADELEARLHKAWNAEGWTIVHMNNRPGYLNDKEGEVPQLMTALCNEITGREMAPYLMYGGTYCRHLRNAYPTGTRLGMVDAPSKLAELPAGHGGAHQRDECVDLEAFFVGLRILIHAVLQCDELLNA